MAAQAAQEEILLEFSGIKSYQHFSQLKEQLSITLPENSTISTKTLSRGQVVFALLSELKSAEVKEKLQNLPTELGPINIMESDDRFIKVELK